MTRVMASGVRRGFTLVEIIVMILIYAVVLAAGIGFVGMNNAVFHRGLDRVTALQSVRLALGSLETDVPTSGAGRATAAPTLVYAGPDALAFAPAGVVGRPGADHGVAPESVAAAAGGPVGAALPAPLRARRTAPGSERGSAIEPLSARGLLVYWFEPDGSTDRADDFQLLRQDGDAPPEQVARNLLRSDDAPFFEYLRAGAPTGSGPTLVALEDAPRWLPASGASAAGGVAVPVRAVRVTLGATNGAGGPDERVVSTSRLIDLRNAGARQGSPCGARPTATGFLDASAVDLGGGDFVSRLTWDATPDDDVGERDVARYVIYRQPASGADWGAPYASIPAGRPTYVFDDPLVEPGSAYRYAVRAQDCTPTQSSPLVSEVVRIPGREESGTGARTSATVEAHGR